jgi:hypothetical protein
MDLLGFNREIKSNPLQAEVAKENKNDKVSTIFLVLGL